MGIRPSAGTWSPLCLPVEFPQFALVRYPLDMPAVFGSEEGRPHRRSIIFPFV